MKKLLSSSGALLLLGVVAFMGKATAEGCLDDCMKKEKSAIKCKNYCDCVQKCIEDQKQKRVPVIDITQCEKNCANSFLGHPPGPWE